MSEQNLKFINSLFLKKLIEVKYNENNVVIRKHTFEPASLETASQLKRILVRYSSEKTKDCTVSFVIKTKSQQSDVLMNGTNFQREATMHKTIIPRLVNMYNGTSENIKFSPRLVHRSDISIDIFMIEDLINQGYSSVEPQHGLTYEQSKISLEKLAFMHAASIIDFQTNLQDYAIFTKGMLNENIENVQKYLVASLNSVIENAEVIKIDGSLVNKLKLLLPDITMKFIENYSLTLNGFQVFNHGDFTTKNILFKYENEHIVDVVFVDFQNSCLGSPLIDLMYFFATSVDYDVLKNFKYRLIYDYHDTLSRVLQKLNYQGYVPTLNELRLEFLKRGILEIVYALTIGPQMRKSCPNIRAVKHGLINIDNNSDKLKAILISQGKEINDQLKIFDYYGLLEKATYESKVRRLLSRFQSV